MARESLVKVLNHGERRTRRGVSYKLFDQIDGTHPWQDAVPEGYVLYNAYQLDYGRVIYFNFKLAKEMGLIPQTHPDVLNSELEEKLLETFNLRIINEHDELSKRRIAPDLIKANKYMATRYLQLQHPDKTGRTSGDGRSIWNGTVRYKGQTWDVSSRGTGVTRLAPGVIEAGKFLKTGGTEFGYGCGTADLDEMLGAAVMSEIFHLQGIPTERTLCVIDSGKGLGIGVRASQNLLRPAHLFNHLKQGNLEALRRAVNYLIDLEHNNGAWDFNSRSKNAPKLLAREMARRFAWVAARADIDYIFFWLDWDGDNVLCNGGIIDYGSIRQLGLRHDEYRYDDVDRFSTSLNEQKNKARQIVQTFAQLADALKTGRKRSITEFKHSPEVRLFDNEFREAQLEWLLYRVGLTGEDRRRLLTNRKDLVKEFFANFRTLESLKTLRKTEKLPDGVNRPAILNMRRVLKELPGVYLQIGTETPQVSSEEFFGYAVAETASRRDSAYARKQTRHARNFQKSYMKLVSFLADGGPVKGVLKSIDQRTRLINREDRITGNSVDTVSGDIITLIQKGSSQAEIQILIDSFVKNQAVLPENHKLVRPNFLHPASKVHKAYLKLLNHVLDYKEDI